MRYLKQFGIIMAVTCAGEVLKLLLPFPVPANIYGLVLMLFLLITGIVSLDSVKDCADFLLEIMPVLFVQPVVAIMVSWNQVKPLLIPILAISIATTVIVMGVTGKVTDGIIGLTGKGEKE